TNTTITDPVPANTTYVAGSGGTLSGSNVQFTIPSTAVGAVSAVTFQVKVNNNLTGVTSISNQASVVNGTTTTQTGPEDPQNPVTPGSPQNPNNPTPIPVSIDVAFTATLSVVTSNPDGKAHPGDELSFTIKVTNTGSGPITNLLATNIIPQFTDYVTNSGGSSNGDMLSFSIPALAVGASMDLTYKVKVEAALGGVKEISSVANVSAGAASVQTNTVKVDVAGGNDLFIPNTFTPNSDGKNDILYVYGSSISSMKFRIYNQWGQLIFQTTSQPQGWDGTHKGELQPSGVYVYYADISFSTGKTITQKGTISLLR
ncbi:gliding motility-associated C-terminal domain-containing protein, partial [Hufsiella ginkgonis]